MSSKPRPCTLGFAPPQPPARGRPGADRCARRGPDTGAEQRPCTWAPAMPAAATRGHREAPSPPGRPGAAGADSPPLVQVDQEHHVVPEARQAVRGGHGDDEGEDVVDEGVEGLGDRDRNRPLGVTRGCPANGPDPVPSDPSQQSPSQQTGHVQQCLSERPRRTENKQVVAPDGP